MVYLDFPLGHTAGRAHDVQSQKAVVMAALRLLEEAESRCFDFLAEDGK